MNIGVDNCARALAGSPCVAYRGLRAKDTRGVVAPPVQRVALTCRHAIFRSDTTYLHKPRDMSRPVVTLLALYALPNVWAFGFRAHGYRPHLAKRTGHFVRSNKKEGGLLRRKGNRDVGPYLDKESFLHSSGFFGDGFMPNIPASVVRKREQASGKQKKKTQLSGQHLKNLLKRKVLILINLHTLKKGNFLGLKHPIP